MASEDSIAALRVRVVELAAREAVLRQSPHFAERRLADDVAREIAATQAKLDAAIAGLTDRIAAAEAYKSARKGQALAAAAKGGKVTQARVARKEVKPPAKVRPPMWDGEDEPAIAWRTTWRQEVQRRYRIALAAGEKPNMPQILREVAEASGIAASTLRRYWRDEDKRQAIINLPFGEA